jgi:hypothetical protein
MFNRKFAVAAALVALGSAGVSSAHASDVQWSVGINLPPVATVISNGPMVMHTVQPVYMPAPVYVQPEPVVVYRPAPVVVYRPVPVEPPRYYGPTVIRSGWVMPSRGWGHHRDRDRDHDRYDRRDGRDGHHDEYGDSRRDDRWAQEPRRQHH